MIQKVQLQRSIVITLLNIQDHIKLRMHFVKQARMEGLFVPYKIRGTITPADNGISI